MTKQTRSCVLLADRHDGLRDGVRGLLDEVFESVFMVANEASLLEGAGRLKPGVVVLDLSLAKGDMPGLLRRVAERSPASKILVLSVHDEPTVTESALASGAEAVVLKSMLASDLLPAIDALRAGRRYVSWAVERRPKAHKEDAE